MQNLTSPSPPTRVLNVLRQKGLNIWIKPGRKGVIGEGLARQFRLTRGSKGGKGRERYNLNI
jgi:hypothetical protein